MDNAQLLKQAYKDLAVSSKMLPKSWKLVCQQAGLEEAEFSQHFASMKALQNAVWSDYFDETYQVIAGSPEYEEYASREKLLAFYYTLLETLRPDREFVQLHARQMGVWIYNPEFLTDFKPVFLQYVKELVAEGIESGEIEDRYIMGQEYSGWHWPQFLYLLNHWVEDESADLAKTDQAVEKAVNLGFDIMGRNVLDSAVDFVRFMFVK